MRFHQPLLRRRATEAAPAHMVFISSVAVLRPKLGTGLYAASKAALSHFVRILAAEAGKDHILVNALAPGWMDTSMTQNARSQWSTAFVPPGLPSLGRHAVPADVARAAAMLLGPDAAYITGVMIAVDGGSSAVYTPDS